MNDTAGGQNSEKIEYQKQAHWHVNTGEQVIHAKRIPGYYRNIKYVTGLVWLIFFLGPYLRWNGHQAVLFDIPKRQFHLFSVTILPQDVWMLSLVLMFFAILLAAITSIAGRVFCGYFCFQTVWTDVYTWIEEKLEGPPAKRHKLDQAPWTLEKLRTRLVKYALWLIIAMLTGVSFAAWFTDAYQLWHDYFTLQAAPAAWTVLALFTVGTFTLAGFMREQACFWLCPYARIQGVMYDRETILPTYDYRRGEPRGPIKKTAKSGNRGDCVDCNLCVTVCPTGVDIREGQQEGCITCALCIDACDSVMDKIKKPHGLIAYMSLDELEGAPVIPLFRRVRVLVYFSIMTLAAIGIIYGLTNLSTIDLEVLHERQPLYVMLNYGVVQNKYVIKILNKTSQVAAVDVEVDGPDGLHLTGVDNPLMAPQYKILAQSIFLRISADKLKQESVPVVIKLVDAKTHAVLDRYDATFFGPDIK